MSPLAILVPEVFNPSVFLNSKVLRKVDFPAPLAPMMAKTSPGLATPDMLDNNCFSGIPFFRRKPQYFFSITGFVDTLIFDQPKVIPPSILIVEVELEDLFSSTLKINNINYLHYYNFQHQLGIL